MYQLREESDREREEIMNQSEEKRNRILRKCKRNSNEISRAISIILVCNDVWLESIGTFTMKNFEEAIKLKWQWAIELSSPKPGVNNIYNHDM